MMTTEQMTAEQRDAAIAALGIEFEPITLNPGKADIPGRQKGEPSEFTIRLTRGKVTVETRYGMGCGLREYIHGRKAITLATGETTTGPNWKRIPHIWGKPTPQQLKALESSKARPQLTDVLYSLLSDAQCGDETFEDFCANFGYDTDSRKALETYLACQESGAKVRKLGLSISKLAELFQDY